MNEEIKKGCTGCSACINVCPKNCITMQKDEWGFLYPVIDQKKCIKCGKCKQICPQKKVNLEETQRKAYYGYHKDEAIRKGSSSGGAFTALAELTLKEKGVVYGAIYDREKQKVYYSSTDQVSLSELRRSKYVQSEMKDILKQMDRDLKQGRKVLFMGTPCHVAGVSSYFEKAPNRKNLLLCDFICHGVPSNQMLRHHIEKLQNKYHSYCKQVNFRPKTDPLHPWYKHRLKLDFENGMVYDKSLNEDEYMIGFIQENLFLRRSCYECQYCNGNRKADITLADFWGVTEYNPSLNDEKGLSLVITHTTKGEEATFQIKESFNLYDLEWRYASYAFKQRNPKKYSLAKREKARKLYIQKGYSKMIGTYVKKHKRKMRIRYFIGLMTRTLGKLKRVLKRVLKKIADNVKGKAYPSS